MCIFPEYDWTKEHIVYDVFKKGKIKCPYEKRVCNTGHLGEGRYNASINGKLTKCYKIWQHMLRRCYDSKYIEKYPSYKDCIVHESWHNFQNFAGWFENDYYKIEGQRMDLNKDILCKGNKIYSPDTCVFVPHRINVLFTKSNSKRGELPIGVSEHKPGYRASIGLLKLGTFTTPHEAFLMYKLNKELLIQGIANEYKNKIPTKLYEALMNYKVEEGD